MTKMFTMWSDKPSVLSPPTIRAKGITNARIKGKMQELEIHLKFQGLPQWLPIRIHLFELFLTRLFLLVLSISCANNEYFVG